MSPLPAPTRICMRADKMGVTTSTSIFSTSTATSTQQSPYRPSSTPGGLILDNATPPSSDLSSLPSVIYIETPAATPSQASQRPGMTFGTKLGLGMIPVVVGLCALWTVFLFWWRRRKAQQQSQVVSPPPPPRVTEKEFMSLVPSLESSRRGSKVFNMAAFSTPIHNDNEWRRGTQVYRESAQPTREATEEDHSDGQNSYTDIIRRAISGASRPDSPTDRTSPFRLKRGNTVRRSSLGSEISNLWPSPPPSAWVKRPVMTERAITERPYPPAFSRQSSLSRPQFCSEDYDKRPYANSLRRAMEERVDDTLPVLTMR
jgi:hypothetical protein